MAFITERTQLNDIRTFYIIQCFYRNRPTRKLLKCQNKHKQSFPGLWKGNTCKNNKLRKEKSNYWNKEKNTIEQQNKR